MTCKMDNTVWMMWKNDEGKSFKVGELSKKTDKYYFKYDMDGVEKAKEYGFSLLSYFPKVDAKYFREELFSSFSKLLPENEKKDKTSILKEYGLDEYDDLELLKKIGDKVNLDNIEFISPFDEEKIIMDEEHITKSEEISSEDEK